MQLVRILKLIHQDVRVAGPPLITRFGVIAKKRAGLEQEIVEIHRVERAQFALVLGEKAAECRVGCFRLTHAEVLRLADDIARKIWIKRVLLVMDTGGELLDEADLIRLVEDAEVLLVTQKVRMLAEQPHAERMEGGESDQLGLLGIDGGADALTHLLGRLVGEGHG